ncbi:MAG: hypothetical protein GY767_12985 [Shimia sp.]|nr:hypothetical protein [Shimia sp.]
MQNFDAVQHEADLQAQSLFANILKIPTTRTGQLNFASVGTSDRFGPLGAVSHAPAADFANVAICALLPLKAKTEHFRFRPFAVIDDKASWAA